MERRGVAVALAGLVVLAAVLRFATLGHESLWYDEALTVHLTKLPFSATALGLNTEAEPPLYFLLARGWTRVFGSSEVGVRSLSAVLGVLTVPVAYGIGRTVLGRRAGLVAAALIAVSPSLVHYSQEARSYALYVLLTAVAMLFFVRALADPRPRDLAGWVVASALAVLSHYFALFPFVAEVAWLLVRHRDRRDVRIALGGAALAVLAIAPVALHQRANGADWIGNSPLRGRLQRAGRFLVVGDALNDVSVRLVQAGWAIVLALAAWGGGGGRARRAAWTGLALAGAVVLVPLAGVPFGSDYILDRNLLAAFVPLAVAAAVALALPRRAWLTAALALPLCALMAWQNHRIFTTEAVQRDDWRAVARALGRPASTRAVVVLPAWQTLSLLRYDRRLRVMGASARVSEVVTVTYQGPRPRPGPTTVSPPPPPFRQVATRQVQRMALTYFRAARPSAYRPPIFPQRFTGEGPLALLESG